MIINAVRASTAVVRILPSIRGCGYVHSVYRQVVNILSSDILISLHPQSVFLSPYSIVLDHSVSACHGCFLDSHIGEPVHIRDSFIILGKRRVTINLKNAQHVSLSLKPLRALTQQDLERWLEKLGQLTEATQSNSLFLNALGCAFSRHTKHNRSDNTFARRSHSILAGIASACEAGSYGDLCSQVRSTIGFGMGLTPSGDDLIVGMLGAFHFFAYDRPIRKYLFGAVASNIHSTTLQSHYMLRAALDGLFPQVLCKMLLAIASDGCLEKPLEQLGSIGATSGDDMLAGVIVALDVLHNTWSKL